mmetsp:Transcript_46232/g.68869  ORF Transcript_46232/g.68869 Transcript_46232/m.68869 type:complete len:85 (+) Transcript_46232:11-265(+)
MQQKFAITSHHHQMLLHHGVALLSTCMHQKEIPGQVVVFRFQSGRRAGLGIFEVLTFSLLCRLHEGLVLREEPGGDTYLMDARP